ncbi:ADP-ribosyltransferase [Plantactinospora sonchi]|uniref:ADP-ribosyltransferase n=1 Tax=Plantactinospora sonchi TaxID=1544735 RepID=A0ABU7RM49_9ACTN
MTAPANPLVAARVDSTEWYTGLGIGEGVADLVNGIESGSWVDTTIGGLSTSLEALGLVVDPIGSLVSYGVSWLMEHVKPLSDALDWLAGDPDQIAANAQTWRNVAQHAAQTAADLRAAVASELAEWAGPAATAYRTNIGIQVDALNSAAQSANGIGSAVEGAGLLVSLVRELVRDLIADLVSILIARIPVWAAEAGLTLGIATPLVVAQATSLIAKWVARISDLLLGLVRSISKLMPMLRQLDDIFAQLWDAFRRAASGSGYGGGGGAPDVRPQVPSTPAGPAVPPGPAVSPPPPAGGGGYGGGGGGYGGGGGGYGGGGYGGGGGGGAPAPASPAPMPAPAPTPMPTPEPSPVAVGEPTPAPGSTNTPPGTVYGSSNSPQLAGVSPPVTGAPPVTPEMPAGSGTPPNTPPGTGHATPPPGGLYGTPQPTPGGPPPGGLYGTPQPTPGGPPPGGLYGTPQPTPGGPPPGGLYGTPQPTPGGPPPGGLHGPPPVTPDGGLAGSPHPTPTAPEAPAGNTPGSPDTPTHPPVTPGAPPGGVPGGGQDVPGTPQGSPPGSPPTAGTPGAPTGTVPATPAVPDLANTPSPTPTPGPGTPDPATGPGTGGTSPTSPGGPTGGGPSAGGPGSVPAPAPGTPVLSDLDKLKALDPQPPTDPLDKLKALDPHPPSGGPGTDTAHPGKPPEAHDLPSGKDRDPEPAADNQPEGPDDRTSEEDTSGDGDSAGPEQDDPADIDGDDSPNVPEELDHNGLSKEDRDSIRLYTGYQHDDINRFLRGDPPSIVPSLKPDEIPAIADRISDALAKLPSYGEEATYRGVYLDDKALQQYEPHKIVTEHGFISTSESMEVAEGRSNKVIMTIRGENGKFIEEYTAEPGEREVLYDRGTQFRVILKYQDPETGQWFITMEEHR